MGRARPLDRLSYANNGFGPVSDSQVVEDVRDVMADGVPEAMSYRHRAHVPTD
jgi:hypothetical protein